MINQPTSISNMEYNNHHLLWPRREYRKNSEAYILRNARSLQVELPIEDHNELHANIDPLPVMSTRLARFALMSLDLLPLNMSRIERLSVLDEKFEKLGRSVGKNAVEAAMFHEYFEAQQVYFERMRIK